MVRMVIVGFSLIMASWWFGLVFYPPTPNAKSYIHEFLYLTGLLAWACMVASLVIAARPAWIERVTRTSLDRLYLWHRYLAIAALVLTIIHWYGKELSAPFMRFFVLEPFKRQVSQSATNWDIFWSWVRQVTDLTIEPVTMIVLFLVVVSFVRYLPYNHWFRLHKLFPILFIPLSIHCIRMMDGADVMLPFGMLNVVITLVGLWFSFQILFFGVGNQKRMVAKVVGVQNLSNYTCLKIKPEHAVAAQAGQFFFLSVDGKEYHPFSIAQLNGDETLDFIVKNSGDYTSTVIPKLAIGNCLYIEGPWGGFLPNVSNADQVWVASGVGIVPFMSWMQYFSNCEGERHIELLWCVKNQQQEALMPKVVDLCKSSRVMLRVFDSKKCRFNPSSYFEEKPSVPWIATCTQQKLNDEIVSATKQVNIHHEYFQWR